MPENQWENKWKGYDENSSKKFLLDAGAFYKNATFNEETGEFNGIRLGATQGGGEFSAVPEIREIEFDGKRGDVKGDKIIDKWSISLLANLMEATKDNLKDALGAADIEAGTNFDKITLRNFFKEEDYIENIAWVGRRSDQTPIIIIIDNGLATQGITVNMADKAEGVLPVRFTAHASGADEELAPLKIYVKKEAA